MGLYRAGSAPGWIPRWGLAPSDCCFRGFALTATALLWPPGLVSPVLAPSWLQHWYRNDIVIVGTHCCATVALGNINATIIHVIWPEELLWGLYWYYQISVSSREKVAIGLNRSYCQIQDSFLFCSSIGPFLLSPARSYAQSPYFPHIFMALFYV